MKKAKVRKVMMLNEGTIQKIQHFIAEDRADSEVEVIRQAVSYYHDKVYPNYIFHLSPAAKEKQKKIEEEEEVASQTDDDFAASIKFFPMENSKGEKFYFYRGLGRNPYIIPVGTIREWAEIPKNKYEIEENLKNYTNEPPEVYFAQVYGDRFREKNDLLMPEFEESSE
jgi:hypothetical protein